MNFSVFFIQNVVKGNNKRYYIAEKYYKIFKIVLTKRNKFIHRKHILMKIRACMVERLVINLWGKRGNNPNFR